MYTHKALDQHAHAHALQQHPSTCVEAQLKAVQEKSGAICTVGIASCCRVSGVADTSLRYLLSAIPLTGNGMQRDQLS